MHATTTHPLAAGPAARDGAWIVLLLSGLLGLRLGLVVFPNWQTSIESAQVIAGVVRYPAPTPASLLFAGEWSLLNQLLAVLLRLGVAEISLTRFVSGLLGVVSVQALAMLAYALCRNVLVALLAACVIVTAHLTDFGATFPVALMGGDTLASLGLPFAVLALSLLGAGYYRLGGFLLGLAPAVHLPWGTALLIPTVAVIGWRKAGDPPAARVISAVAAGVLVAAASLIVQLAFVAPLPALRAAGDLTLARFVELWDSRRGAVSPFADAVYLTVGVLMLALTWLVALRDDLTAAARLVLGVLGIVAAASLPLALLTWAAPAAVPTVVLMLGPGRFVNIGALTFVAVLFGVLGVYATRRWGSRLIAAAALGLVLGPRSVIWQRLGVTPPEWISLLNPWLILQLATVALIAMTLHEWNARFAGETPAARSRAGIGSQILLAVTTIALVARLVTLPSSAIRFSDRLNDPLFNVAAKGDGILLSSGPLQLVQLRSRRPVLFDRALEGFPSILGSSADVTDILKVAFDIDVLNPPPEALHTAGIPADHNKRAWEQFPVDRWQEIRRRFDVRHVLANADWSLALPVEAQSRELRLYQIPD